MQVSIERVTHSFGELKVLSDINFVAADGEVVALIGPSGCGKSTLLGMIGGLAKPGAGKVMLSGATPPGCLNPLTYVFQDFALLPWRNVRDNIAFALNHHPLAAGEREERIKDALARTGLTDFAGALPKQLSGGMRQRVGIARALAVSPAVLLLDEPLSALDAQTRDLLMDDFAGICLGTGLTAIYVTHNLDEAVRLADRVVVLSRRPGQVREIVTMSVPREDRKLPSARPLLAQTQEYLWNLIRGEAQSADKELLHAA